MPTLFHRSAALITCLLALTACGLNTYKTDRGFGHFPGHAAQLNAVAYYSDGPGRTCAIYTVKSARRIGLACGAGTTDATIIGFGPLKQGEPGCASPRQTNLSGRAYLEQTLRAARHVELITEGIDVHRRPIVRLVLNGQPLGQVMAHAGYALRPGANPASTITTHTAPIPAYRPGKTPGTSKGISKGGTVSETPIRIDPIVLTPPPEAKTTIRPC